MVRMPDCQSRVFRARNGGISPSTTGAAGRQSPRTKRHAHVPGVPGRAKPPVSFVPASLGEGEGDPGDSFGIALTLPDGHTPLLLVGHSTMVERPTVTTNPDGHTPLLQITIALVI